RPVRISPNLRDRWIELLLAAPSIINICAFGYITLRRSDSNTAAATRDPCDLTSRFAHFSLHVFSHSSYPLISAWGALPVFERFLFSVHWPMPLSPERCRHLLGRTRG